MSCAPRKERRHAEGVLDELGPKRCAKLEAVTINMSRRVHQGRRHDEVVSEEERKQLTGMRWPLLKCYWNLSLFESSRLSSLQRDNMRLYRAYLLKDAQIRVPLRTSGPQGQVGRTVAHRGRSVSHTGDRRMP
jgi:hypothetical protein